MTKTQYTLVIFCQILFISKSFANDQVVIDFQKSTNDVRLLRRFWTNTGFSPLENNLKFFESNDLSTNLEIIGSLPNKGLRNVRIHWLLDLLKIK